MNKKAFFSVTEFSEELF